MSEAEPLARRFHEAYERLAPEYGYKTRPESAVAWEDVPAPNRALMIAAVADATGPITTDAQAIDQIAGLLGLYVTDPGNNPVDELLASIEGWVQSTGRATNVPEGA